MAVDGARGGADAIPPGRSGNPSRWGRRLPVVVLALLGCVVSGYLALYQYGVLADVWDPFFGEGSRAVLTSPLSEALPVRDAALGCAAYLFEAVAESAGGRRRWREHPWTVLLVGATAAALALTGLLLVIAQPLLTGTFCTLCLVSAGISFAVAALVAGEVAAALRVVLDRR
ncbi:vitamin K epoxide reductase family protein [Marinitenerispora sediminis]|uniref:Vitamin K epoxide reductase n=1 Tax=Marinitenerispora sediminis TaxID=1931232 RepID=A0A368T454_9ACTN|nr:vitamin K epoxide reductase family protein [Marinitenerispora sediminis]RCV50345.1 vitamin K epoxide reductase [Marinitenerispora sediminis]RCV53622.1 vitamin K epoxide reductase [Marinitenerispora sediminis]RCV57917.1 vitamin K epoxide reductase [Marinitenerispora sediminis]